MIKKLYIRGGVWGGERARSSLAGGWWMTGRAGTAKGVALPLYILIGEGV